jgi:predicted hydrocarbon binding protein
MPDPQNEKLAALLQHLQVSESGIYVLDGLRHVMLPAQLFPELQAVGDRFLGAGWAGVMYYVGEAFGHGMALAIQRQLGVPVDANAASAFIVAGAESRGFGQTEIAELDLGTGRGVWRFHDCTLGIDDPASGRSKPSCPFPCGALGGIMTTLSGKEVIAEETRCRCLGDPYCEFVTAAVEPSARTETKSSGRGSKIEGRPPRKP